MDTLAQARPTRLDPDYPPAVNWPPALDFTRGMDVHIGGRGLGGRRRVLAALASAAALGLVIAILIAARPVIFPGLGHPRPAGRSQSAPASPTTSPATKPARSHFPAMTGRAALLMTAAHVPHAPFGGRYWHTLTEQGSITAGGTRAYPYAIAVPQLREMWLSPQPGQRDFSFTEQLAARPATLADRARWQAAGSPTSWNYPTHPTTSGPTRRAATWWTSQGNIGLLEGDLPYLTKAQFARLPASPAALLATLYAKAQWLRSVSRQHLTRSDEHWIVWIELLQVVTGPVPWQVRAAAFRVLAGLPGMRSAGPMRDPAGRPGYGVRYHLSLTGTQILVLSPATGTLLAIKQVGAPDGLAAGRPKRSSGSQGPYYYRFHRGQIDLWTVFMAAGWTNARPQLPVPPVRQAHSRY